MRTYVISDIHGDYDRFMTMLRLIRFTEMDTLYVLGDVIDRGKKGIEVLEYIMEHKNILMVKGNHEYMMQESFLENGHGIDYGNLSFTLWRRNGGNPTLKTLLYKRNSSERKKIYEFINGLPLFYDNVEVGGEVYYLVHGKPLTVGKRPYEEAARDVKKKYGDILPTYEEYLVWERVEATETYFSDKIVVFGHTPTDYYQTGIPYDIWYGDKVIGIDCGCGKRNAYSRLACLCLDTMEEFYV